MEKRLKVLVSAYACEPHKGSEPGVGWNWAKELSRFHEVWLITRTNNRIFIEEELSKQPIPNLQFAYVDLPRWIAFWKRGQKGLYLYYFLWQLIAYQKAKALHKHISFDVVHHTTFGSILLPTFMPCLKVPFIWGPVGGAELIPKSLRKNLTSKSRIYEKFRDLIVFMNYKLNPLTRISISRAKLILCRTKITLESIPSKYKIKSFTMVETGVNKEFIEGMAAESNSRDSQKILMAGRLLHLKGFDLGIKAFSKVQDKYPEAQLIILGSGPEEFRLKSLAQKQSEAKRIIFGKSIPRAKFLELLREAHIFLMPSMKEAGTWVLFEAMAAAVPVVCLDYSGPGDIVDDNCAIKVPVGPEQQVIRDLSAALDRLLGSKKLAKQIGTAGPRRLMDYYLWESKGDTAQRLYGEVLKEV